MENNLHRLRFGMCFIMASYMSYLQFNYFSLNDDMATISYQYFNDEKEGHEYPTFTICFYGNQHIFNESSDVFKSKNVTPLSYRRFLEAGLINHSQEHGEINYHDIVLNIYDAYIIPKTFLEEGDVREKDDQKSYFSSMSTLHFPSQVCFSKIRRSPQTHFETVNLNATLLFDRKITISAYVHQKGKMIKSLAKSSIPLVFPNEYKNGTQRWYGIHWVEVLRRRENSKIPCNESLINEDAMILQMVMEKIGCIPSFWEQLAKNKSFNNTIEKCKRHKQYRALWELYNKVHNKALSKDSGIDSTNRLYLEPCTEMKVSTIARKYDIPYPDVLQLNFVYLENTYKDISNQRAYTFETLVGQVGGFVGKN